MASRGLNRRLGGNLVAQTGHRAARGDPRTPVSRPKGHAQGCRLERAASGRGRADEEALDLVAPPGPSWNQVQDWLTQLGRLKVDLECRAPAAP